MLLNHIIPSIKKHISLLVIVFGAGCLFLSNIITKNIFSKEEYGKYSVIITYFSLLYLFGIFGTEQGFIRFSNRKEKGVVETHKSQIILVFCIALFSSIVGGVFFKLYYSDILLNNGLLFISGFCIIILLFLFNTLRLNEDFALSQLISNYWRISLFALSLFYLLCNHSGFENYITILAINIVLGTVLAFFFVFRKIKFTYSKTKIDLSSTFFHFFLAISTFTLLTFSDRFLVENKFSIEEFGNYFYLTNLFLAPYSILQNYIGFKQLVLFKNNFTVEYFNKQNRKSIIIGLFLGAFLLGAANIVSYFKILDFDFKNTIYIVLLLILTGILRLYSASILAAFEAKVSVETLKKSNIIIIIITSVVLTIAIYAAKSLEAILFCVAIIWVLRALVQRYLLLKQHQKQPE